MQIYINLNKLIDAVTIQRKILHTLEVSKVWMLASYFCWCKSSFCLHASIDAHSLAFYPLLLRSCFHLIFPAILYSYLFCSMHMLVVVNVEQNLLLYVTHLVMSEEIMIEVFFSPNVIWYHMSLKNMYRVFTIYFHSCSLFVLCLIVCKLIMTYLNLLTTVIYYTSIWTLV